MDVVGETASSLPHIAAQPQRQRRGTILRRCGNHHHHNYCSYKRKSTFVSFLRRPLQGILLFLLPIVLFTNTNTNTTCWTDAFGIDTGNATYDDEPEPIDDAPPRFAVLFPWFIQVIGVMAFFIITRYELIIPFQAIMFLIGAAMGIVSTIRYNTIDTTSHAIVDELDQLSISILQWSEIDSAVLLLVFLPGLIFRDAIEGTEYIITHSYGCCIDVGGMAWHSLL